jgi:hypothetical protein
LYFWVAVNVSRLGADHDAAKEIPGPAKSVGDQFRDVLKVQVPPKDYGPATKLLPTLQVRQQRTLGRSNAPASGGCSSCTRLHTLLAHYVQLCSARWTADNGGKFSVCCRFAAKRFSRSQRWQQRASVTNVPRVHM